MIHYFGRIKRGLVFKIRNINVVVSHKYIIALHTMPGKSQSCLKFKSSLKWLLLNLLKSIRWLIIIFGVGWVVWGWYGTTVKKIENKRAVSTETSKFTKFRYPSLTVCRTFKNKQHVLRMLKNISDERGKIK